MKLLAGYGILQALIPLSILIYQPMIFLVMVIGGLALMGIMQLIAKAVNGKQ